MGEIIVRPKPPVPMPFTGERLTSDYGGQTQIEHLHRYLLAREWCRDKDVLDVASGEGYGTALLAQTAKTATGVEIAQDAVDHANASYEASNLQYFAGDARKLPMPDAAFDVVVSFETIEHFAEHDVFLREIRRVLRPGGLFIVSTPDRDNYSPAETPANPYHVKEMTEPEFYLLLQAHFASVSALLQRPMYGSVLMPNAVSTAMPVCFERRGDLHFEGSTGLSRPQYLMAFASDHPITALSSSVYIETGRLGLLSPAEAEARFMAAEKALTASQAEQGRIATELVRMTETLQEEQAQIEAYGVAARERAAELEVLQAELAKSRTLGAEVEAYARAEQERMQEVDALRVELAGLRGEVRGLQVASGMAESAILAMRERVDEAIRKQSMAEADTILAQTIGNTRASTLEAELATARARAEAAAIHARSLESSTSWQLTAPLRAVIRIFLRRS